MHILCNIQIRLRPNTPMSENSYFCRVKSFKIPFNIQNRRAEICTQCTYIKSLS